MTEILLIMPASHRRSILTDETAARLAEIGTLREAPTATDHADPRVRQLLSTADVLVTGTGTAKLEEQDLRAAPHAKAIIHAAGSLRPVVGKYAYDLGFAVSSLASANAVPVAEYTLAMILLELKGVNAIAATYRRARSTVDVDALLARRGVYNATVGIVGASRIGRLVIEHLRRFDVDVLLADPSVDRPAADQLGVQLVDLPTLVASADVISLHAPLLPETRHLLDGPLLARIRDGAVLINTARGALVDPDALVTELLTGRFRAVLDVTDPEPPPPTSPLWDLDNVVLTPHVAGSRGMELQRIGQEVVAEVERLVRGEPLRYSVPRHLYAGNA
jgi:phosphoglycerate dehydrogenase-like enzyme